MLALKSLEVPAEHDVVFSAGTPQFSTDTVSVVELFIGSPILTSFTKDHVVLGTGVLSEQPEKIKQKIKITKM